MMKEGIAWRFQGNPIPESRFFQTIQKEVTNCVFEEVTLEQSHGTEAVFCAEGKISESHKTGYAVRH